jgi:predicted ATP-grasp superfamily ATP-dependent carboligase
MKGRRPPVLLMVADYHGTLAAVRSLGRAGISVTVADWRRLVPARWSRYAVRSVTCPSIDKGATALIDWLLEFGARTPGHVLLATTDDLAWLFARHRNELAQHFRLDSPPLDAIYTLLNKWQLYEACAAEGIEVPESVLAGSGRTLPTPLLIKPQTQVLLSPHQKGRLVERAEDLEPALADFRAATRYDSTFLAFDPSAAGPMLQQYVEAQEGGIYSLSGFVDGEHFTVNAARKVLQRPRRLGVGLCFETTAVDEDLAERVLSMCRNVGYRGVFEIELLEAQGKRLLIDFNPRFFGQMAFDVARGTDLPLLAYLLAVGDRRALETALHAARKPLPSAPRAWCDRINLALFLSVLRLSGSIDRHDAAYWAHWLRGDPHDPVLDRQDVWPGVVAAGSSLWHQLRHARSVFKLAREL